MLRMVRLRAARIPSFNPEQQGLRWLCQCLNIAVGDMFGRLQYEGFEDEEAAAYALGVGPMEAHGAHLMIM
jgi:hypothetical protein